ncbi:tol-pal system protein YbgF [Hydrogenophaga sp. OTU3427]|uniref:tol-pal system protein YbgF n=1 Tax=Hydrogenophaga sp. OTU3427 TaxID=3043856 RepID=UPI00313BB205
MSSLTRALLRTSLLAAAVLAAAPSHALFGDDEARRAIIELRDKVEANRQATDAAQQRLQNELSRVTEENAAPTRRSLLELSNQIETLRAEMARLRGQNEQLARDVAELQRQQKDVLVALDERLRTLEPMKVQLDGAEFTASPAEKRDFEAAMAELRKTEFPRAAQLYQQFLRRYPDSGYAPAAHYWLGNTHYALREYKDAITVYQRLIGSAPSNARVPEAMLAIANCQIELKDVKAAKRSLEDLVKAHPQSEAAATARDRLARLR